MLAAKIASCTGSTTEGGEYFYTTEETRQEHLIPIKPRVLILLYVAKTIIKNIRAQNMTLSRKEVVMLKNGTAQIILQTRASLAEYIRGIPLEFE
ncbi:hypothetical protein GJ496_002188 [Pomphorhynchus laevis]|nr:hypothetical protein GJ496_002188 [Pomphorhynchus laevis]